MNLLKYFIIRCFGQKKKIDFAFDLNQIRSVLLKPIGDALGDSIVHSAHLKQLKSAFPHLRIGVFVSARNKMIFQQSGLVDELLPERWKTYWQQREKWDLYLDFMPTFTTQSIIKDKLLSAKWVVNFGKENKKYYNLQSVKNYDFSTALSSQIHFKDYLNQSVLAPFLAKDVSYFLPNVVQHQSQVAQFWQEDKLRILLCPQGSIRQIPVAEFAYFLQQNYYLKHNKVQWLLSNAQGAEDYFAQLSQSLPQVSLASKTDLATYLALVNSADIVIAVDGGAVHVACAYGKPLLAFCANYPQSLNKWYPNIHIDKQDACVVVNESIVENANQTENFPLFEATDWLNQQIEKRLPSSSH